MEILQPFVRKPGSGRHTYQYDLRRRSSVASAREIRHVSRKASALRASGRRRPGAGRGFTHARATRVSPHGDVCRRVFPFRTHDGRRARVWRGCDPPHDDSDPRSRVVRRPRRGRRPSSQARAHLHAPRVHRGLVQPHRAFTLPAVPDPRPGGRGPTPSQARPRGGLLGGARDRSSPISPPSDPPSRASTRGTAASNTETWACVSTARNTPRPPSRRGSTITCVASPASRHSTPHSPNRRQRASPWKVRKMKGRSAEMLSRLRARPGGERFDVAYVDGSHAARDVMIDAAIGWELLRRAASSCFMIIDGIASPGTCPARGVRASPSTRSSRCSRTR